MPKVFISHSTQDQKFIEQEILPILKKHQIEPWYCKESIRTADYWERQIKKGLEACEWFMLIMSPRSANSEWVRVEVHWAVENRLGHIIPVLYETCKTDEFHLMLLPIQHVDFRYNLDDAREKLIETFKIESGKHYVSPETIADLTEASPPISIENASLLLKMALVCYQKGDYNRAIKDLTDIIKVCSNYVNAYILRGITCISKREYDKAIADLTTAINFKPEKGLASLAYTWRGNSYARKDEYQKGIADCTEAIRLRPMNAQAYHDRGVMYYRGDKYDEALNDLNESIRINPRYTKSYISRAGIYRYKGEWDKAKADYDQAIKIYPAIAKEIDFEFSEGTIQLKIDEAYRSIKALEPITRLDKLSPDAKVRSLKNLQAIGWAKILEDLEFLEKNLPGDHRHQVLIKELLNVVHKVKKIYSEKELIMPTYTCSRCGYTTKHPSDTCPECRCTLSGVKCRNEKCGYVGTESDFAKNGCCPKCGFSRFPAPKELTKKEKLPEKKWWKFWV